MAFPTAAAVTHKTPFIRYLLNSEYMPAFNYLSILHAEQIVTMVKDKI
jgi:hypothetical protein